MIISQRNTELSIHEVTVVHFHQTVAIFFFAHWKYWTMTEI